MRRFPYTLAAISLVVLSLAAPSSFAKKAPAAPDTGSTKKPGADSPASNADAAKAELSATVAIASIKLGRVAIAEDASLADVKDTVGGIYDRQESATKSGLDKLHSAGGDAKAKASALAALSAADDEASAYFSKNPSVNDKIKRRVSIINAEVGQISRTPDAYVATLEKVGVSGDALGKAKAVVNNAAAKAGGKTDGDSLDPCLSARTQVHQMMSARQLKALDGQFSGR